MFGSILSMPLLHLYITKNHPCLGFERCFLLENYIEIKYLMKDQTRIKVFISFIIAKSFILIGKFVQYYRCGLINIYLILTSHQHITHSLISSSLWKSVLIYFLLKMSYRDMKANIPILKSAHLLMKVSNILSPHETYF